MTALWASLIVLGIAMITFAVWPSIRGLWSGGKSAAPGGAEAGAPPGESGPDGF